MRCVKKFQLWICIVNVNDGALHVVTGVDTETKRAEVVIGNIRAIIVPSKICLEVIHFEPW
jgi:hypothetical protein